MKSFILCENGEGINPFLHGIIKAKNAEAAASIIGSKLKGEKEGGVFPIEGPTPSSWYLFERPTLRSRPKSMDM